MRESFVITRFNPALQRNSDNSERAIVTEEDSPTSEKMPAPKASGMNIKEASTIRREIGLDGLTVELPPDFDNPAFSRQMLGLPE